MDTLFNAVNKAWLASAYPQSKACTSAAYKQTTRGGGNGASGSGSGSGTSGSGSGTGSGSGSGNGSRSMVAPDWSCSYCAGKIRLISITGGSLDTLVHPTITRLDGLAQENVQPPPTPTPIHGFFRPILDRLSST